MKAVIIVLALVALVAGAMLWASYWYRRVRDSLPPCNHFGATAGCPHCKINGRT